MSRDNWQRAFESMQNANKLKDLQKHLEAGPINSSRVNFDMTKRSKGLTITIDGTEAAFWGHVKNEYVFVLADWTLDHQTTDIKDANKHTEQFLKSKGIV